MSETATMNRTEPLQYLRPAEGDARKGVARAARARRRAEAVCIFDGGK